MTTAPFRFPSAACLLVCLLLQALPGLAEEKKEFVLTPRAEMLMEQAPRTPEDLLLRIRQWMADPYMDGTGFGEKITGTEKWMWGRGWLSKGRTVDDNFIDYVVESNLKKIGYRHNLPYDVRSVQITYRNHLRNIHIIPRDSNFCITPALTRQLLGEPSRQRVLLKWYCEDWGADLHYPVLQNDYRDKGKKFLVRIRFRLSENDLQQNPCPRYKATVDILVPDFEKDENICAKGLSFGIYSSESREIIGRRNDNGRQN